MSKRALNVLLPALFIIFIITVSLWLSAERKSLLVMNDLKDQTWTSLHIIRRANMFHSEMTYFAYPMHLEPGNQEPAAVSGNDVCISMTTGSQPSLSAEAWKQLDLPRFKSILRLSELSKYATRPCTHTIETPTELSNNGFLAPWNSTDTTETTTDTQGFLDPSTSKVGDMVAGLKLASIAPFFETSPLSSDNIKATFDGKVTVTGAYDYSMNDFAGEAWTCLTITNPADVAKLPRLKDVDMDGSINFCLSNRDEAAKLLGPEYNSGTATVTIDQYEINYAPAEVTNQARLVSVEKKKAE